MDITDVVGLLRHQSIALYHPHTFIGKLLLHLLLSNSLSPILYLPKPLIPSFTQSLHQKLTLKSTPNLSSLSILDQQSLGQSSKIDILINCSTICYSSKHTTEQLFQCFYRIPRRLRASLQKTALLIQLATVYHLPQGFVDEEYVTKSSYSETEIKNLIAHHPRGALDLCLQQAILGNSLLIRCPVVTACWEQPTPGYCQDYDRLCQLYQLAGRGIIHSLIGKKATLVDMAPADLLSNFIVAAAAFLKGPDVINFSTRSRNPLSAQQLVEICNSYFRDYPFSTINANIAITDSRPYFNLQLFRKRLPLMAKQQVGRLFSFQKIKVESAFQLQKIRLAEDLVKEANSYLEEGWTMDSSKAADLYMRMIKQDRERFQFEPIVIDWENYIRHSIYGLRHFILKQKLERPAKPGDSNLIALKSNYFEDVYWAFTNGVNHYPRHHGDVIKKVINSRSVREAIRNILEERKSKLNLAPVTDSSAEQELVQVAQKICKQMFSNYEMKALRVFAYSLHKIFRRIYQQVNISIEAFTQLKKMQSQGPLILIPTHRSYIDFLIISFIFFCQGIRCPFIAAAEDFLSMTLVHHLLRASGAFFIKRKGIQHPTIYKAVMSQYISTLLADHNNLQFFIEGTRSRTGKMLSPKYGILSIVGRAVETGLIKDAIIVPITINYERVLEGQTFPYELLGEEKVKETLSRLIKASEVVLDNYGRIFIEVCTPISYQAYRKQKQAPERQVIQSLGWQVVYRMSEKTVVMATALTSTVILMSRRGIRQSDLNETVVWLSSLVQGKGYKLGGGYEHSPSVAVNDALKFLNSYVDKTRRNVFEINIEAKDVEAKNVLMLAYYRNTITHIFFHDAILAVALASFGREYALQGVPLTALSERALWLADLLDGEYVIREHLSAQNMVEKVRKLQGHRIMRVEGEGKGLTIKGDVYLQRLCYFIWAIVQGYWLTFLYMEKYFKGDKAGLIGQIQQKGYEMNIERRLDMFECLDLNIIGQALKKQASKRASEMELRPFLKRNWEDSCLQSKL